MRDEARPHDLAYAFALTRRRAALSAATGANPIPIVIPCHRVIGSNGSLTGFGGGVEVKRFLLNHVRTRGFEPGLL